MELWIRSQNKRDLIKINNISLSENDTTIITYVIEFGSLELAEYKLKERALEVLDEIQKIIGWLQNDMKDVTIGNYKRLIGSFDNYVYEMPEE